MRTGVLGGTFDPVHNGHIAIAAAVRHRLQLDTVRFVPCRRPPHKDRPDLTLSADRLAMVALGTQDDETLVPCSAELARPAPSFTIDTLREMSRHEPAVQFVFIMGMDSFRELDTWKEYEALIRDYHLAVVGRPSHRPSPQTGDVPADIRERLVDGATGIAGDAGRIHFIEAAPVDVSATGVREQARRGDSLDGLVPAPVAAYIRKCALYRS
ncbi:MAG: nicotinate-nucleotide adenylyltransferase [Rhodospirillales bacterium]